MPTSISADKERETLIQQIDALNQEAWNIEYEKPAAALKLAQEALDLSLTYAYRKGEGNAHLNTGYFYIHAGAFHTARPHLENALAIFRSENLHKCIGTALSAMSLYHHRLQDNQKAIGYAEEALRIFEQLNDKKSICESTLRIAGCYEMQADYSRALSGYQKCMELAEQIDFKKGIAGASGSMGSLYYAIGEYPKALEYYTKAIEIFIAEKNFYNLVIGYSGMGNVCVATNNYAGAIENFSTAMRYAVQVGDKDSQGLVLNNLGMAHAQWHHHAEARDCFEKALTLYEEAGQLRGMAHALVHLGGYYRMMNQPEKAFSYIHRGYLMFEQLSQKDVAAEALLALTKVCMTFPQSIPEEWKKDRTANELVADYLDRILQAAEEIEVRQIAYAVHELYAQYYAQLGDTAKALEHFKKYHEIKEKVFNEESDKRLKNLQVLHDVEQAKLKERQHIRQKIHGDTLSTVTLVCKYVSLLQSESMGKPAKELVSLVQHHALKAEADLRQMQWSLASDVKTLYDLFKHLEKTARDLFVNSSRFSATKPDAEWRTINLSADAVEKLCDLFQLAFTNAWRHADAGTVFLSATLEDERLTLCFTDNGNGFDVKNISDIGGVGDMRKLASELGASLTVHSTLRTETAEGGTEIKFSAPLSALSALSAPIKKH